MNQLMLVKNREYCPQQTNSRVLFNGQVAYIKIAPALVTDSAAELTTRRSLRPIRGSENLNDTRRSLCGCVFPFCRGSETDKTFCAGFPPFTCQHPYFLLLAHSRCADAYRPRLRTLLLVPFRINIVISQSSAE